MNDRNSGSANTAIIAIVGLIVLMLLVYFLFLRNPDNQTELDVDIDPNGAEQVDPIPESPGESN